MRRFILKMVPLLLIGGLAKQTFSHTGNTSGQTSLPGVSLSGKDGGLHNGNPWNSNVLRDKANLLFYIDPDKQKQVKPLLDRLDAINFSTEKLGSTFILNTSATIIPDFILRHKVAERARADKTVRYVLDLNRVLVEKWQLKDDDINILLFDAGGNLLFKHSGDISPDLIQGLIEKIKTSINTGDVQ